MKFFPEGDGGNAVILLENGVKLKIIVIAALLGDLFQRQIGTANKSVCVFEPHLNDVLFRGNAHLFLNKSRKWSAQSPIVAATDSMSMAVIKYSLK